MGTENNKHIQRKSWFLNLFGMSIEILVLIVFFILFALFFLLLVAVIFQSLNICDKYICWIESELLYLDRCQKINLVTAFGVFGSLTFTPIVTFLVTLIFSINSSKKEIDAKFSKFNKLSFYIISFPFGIWNSQVINYQGALKKSTWEKIPLLFYDYCLCLVFNNDCFQSYQFILDSVSYYNQNSDMEIQLRHRNNASKIPYFISDTAGIIYGESQEGATQLSVLLRTENYYKITIDQCIKNNEFIKYFINDSIKRKEISFNVCLRTNDMNSLEELRNALKGKFYYWFCPLTRTFFKYIIGKIQRGRQYEVRLKLESAPYSINEENTKFKFNIVDIDISTKKNRPDK